MRGDDTTGSFSTNDPEYAAALQAVVSRDDHKFDVDVRRFALDAALQFASKDVGLGAIQNHAAILLCAEEFRRWLDDGTLPDIDKEIQATATFAWNVARGLFPETLVAQAQAAGK